MKALHRVLGLGLLCLLATTSDGQAPQKKGTTPADKVAAPVVVLDTMGSWRIHETLKPPVIRDGAGVRPLLSNVAWVDQETAPPEANWMKPDFDDRHWLRGSACYAGPTAFLARLCLRGKFMVTDPAKVKKLTLNMGYQGGAVVYVNGRELTRGHVASGADGLAEDYPATVFLNNDGSLLTFEKARRNVPAGDPRRVTLRRSLARVEIPLRMLRRGVNVVAIDVLRAPYPKVIDEKRDAKQGFWMFAWDTCQANSVQVTAATADGLVPNAVRPEGFRVWNSNLLASDWDVDSGDPNELLQPIKIVGARNGSFSGKVVVGSERPIRGLKVSAGTLKGPGGTIAATQVTVRYALPWGDEDVTVPYAPYPYPVYASLLGALAERAPEEIPVRSGKRSTTRGKAPWPEPIFGAVASVWVTVQVPRDAKAGAYSGAITINAEGEKPVRVPVELRVADWTLPDAQDYRTLIEIIESPDTLAAEYDVPLWSDKHWNLVAKSFKLLSDSGNRFVYVPLVAETNFGHGQSMVRWVKTGQDTYDYDFSILDRYLDTAEKSLGQPKTVVFLAWDVYMLTEGGGEGAHSKQEQATLIKERKRRGVPIAGRGPVVTVLDRASGKTSNVELPRYEEPGSAALWKPLHDQLRQRMVKRGLDKAMMLGMLTDAWPTKAEVNFLAEMAPGVPWVSHAHFPAGPNVYKSAKTGYRIGVWALQDPGATSLMGWKRPSLLNRYYRQRGFNSYPPAMWRYLVEYAISGNQRGIGRLGGEFWPVLKDKRGRRVGAIYSRYPQSNWRNLDIYTSLIAPGPNGPVATPHYQYLVEGIQECQARILIENALSEPALKQQLGSDLATRCQAVLDERLRCIQRSMCPLINRFDRSPIRIVATGNSAVATNSWCVGSDWESRVERLYALAGDVARKLGKSD